MEVINKAQLGIGSGVLTQDVIDKIKEVDVKNSVDPITRQIQKNSTKQKDLTVIKTLVSTFKATVSGLSDNSSYLKRNIQNQGSQSASITANNGVSEQNISIKVLELAKQDVYQSKRFTKNTSNVLSDTNINEASFKLSLNGKDYTIKANLSTTIVDIADQINEQSNGAIQAKVLNTGGTDPYRLIIQSKDTGKNNTIEFKYDENKEASKILLKSLGFEFEDSDSNEPLRITSTDSHIQSAQDSSFEFNGVQVVRSSNTINDLATGINITLNKKDKDGELSNISIKQNNDEILKDIREMVKTYNSLMDNVNSATTFDPDSNTSGIFVGVNEIIQIRVEINSIINGVYENGKSIQNFGLEINKNGTLQLDNEKLKNALDSDMEGFTSFFGSQTKYKDTNATAKSPISSGEIRGTFSINNVNIDLQLDSTSSIQAKQEAIIKAINDANILNITANFTPDGKLNIRGRDGTGIDINGDSEFLAKLGLEVTQIDAQAQTNIGFFEKLNKKLSKMIDSKGLLTSYEENLTHENTKLNEQKKQTQQQIDAKYAMMAQKFATYDKMINKLNAQFEALQQTINAELKTKK